MSYAESPRYKRMMRGAIESQLAPGWLSTMHPNSGQWASPEARERWIAYDSAHYFTCPECGLIGIEDTGREGVVGGVPIGYTGPFTCQRCGFKEGQQEPPMWPLGAPN